MNDDNLMFDTSVLEEQEIKFEKVVEEPVVSVATSTKSIPVRTAEVVTTRPKKPKTVRPSAPVIEDWDTDSDNDGVFRPKTNQTKPKFTKINFVKSDENVKFVNKENTHKQIEYPRKSQSPKGNRRNWNGMITQKLGNGFEFTKKACFVCGSFNHLIKDCEDRLVSTVCERQENWICVLTRLIDDLLALDSIVRFGFSNRSRATASCSIQLTVSEKGQ
ncbi:hypothetical protein Tco_0150854 [Tanacetum coccineum]